eukprot:415364-Pelagomonas_calceolata.AAC.2
MKGEGHHASCAETARDAQCNFLAQLTAAAAATEFPAISSFRCWHAPAEPTCVRGPFPAYESWLWLGPLQRRAIAIAAIAAIAASCIDKRLILVDAVCMAGSLQLAQQHNALLATRRQVAKECQSGFKRPTAQCPG